jgi:hypothetical protein
MGGVPPNAVPVDPTAAAIVLILLAAVVMLTAAATGFRPFRRRSPKPAPPPPPVAAAKPDPLASCEGSLVRQLVTAEITPHRYRQEMENLAAREDERNRLEVPPDQPGR